MMRGLRALGLGAIAMLTAMASAQPLADPNHENVTWYAIVADNEAALGHASLQVVQRSDGRDVIESQEIYLREQGGQPTRTRVRSVRSEDAAGRTLSITDSAQTGGFSSRTEARMSGSTAHIVRETPSGRWAQEMTLPQGIRFDDGDALLRAWDPAVTPRLEFEAFNIDAMTVERIVIEASDAPDAQGRVIALRRRYEGGELRGVARLVIDSGGRVVEVAQPMFGSTISVSMADRATALRAHPPYQVVPSLMTQSPFRISTAAARGRMRYRFAFRAGLSFAPPQTGEQRAAIDAEGVTIDVCADCGPGLASDAATLADALRPTAWLQSDAPRLREIAAPVARLAVSGARKMELLIDRARRYLEHFDYNGHYSALDTVVRRTGDCTEAAVLLAALGRAAGIPTRVASGLSYSRQSYHGVSNAFLPHSWTLAFVDGAWRSFDLALEEFDSTHIALTVGDGDPRSIAAAGQLASLLRLDTVAEVRRRGS